MKTTKKRLIPGIIAVLMMISGSVAVAQEEGGSKTDIRDVPYFNGIDAGSIFDVVIRQSDRPQVKIEASENPENVVTEVKGEILNLSLKGKSPKKLKIYIQMPDLKTLKVHGAADINSDGKIRGTTLKIDAGGAANINLELEMESIDSEISGAANVKLSGNATNHTVQASGAANLRAGELITQNTTANGSGAADLNVHATQAISGKMTGASNLNYTGNPEIKDIKKSGVTGLYNDFEYHENDRDSTKIKIGNLDIEVFEEDDSVRVKVGNHELNVDEDGNVTIGRVRKHPKFNGHWAGFDLGLNGYFNTGNNMNFPAETEYMDLRMGKSWHAGVNIYEQNIALVKSQKLGLVSGVGFRWNNFSFDKDTRLNADSSKIIGYVDRGIDIKKSKLTILYLDIPLMLEFQTNPKENKNSFHLGAGMKMGIRLSSHTKKYYEEKNKDFEVTRYNPDSKTYETVFTAESPDENISKDFDDFFLNPFQWDAMVRIGWGKINLFADYSVNSLFRQDKGPELYPWSVGITLTDF